MSVARHLEIACIPGDGIGPEIVAEAKKVLTQVCEKYGHTISYTDVLMGGCSIDAYGVPLTQETIDICKSKQAVLMGSIGGLCEPSPCLSLPGTCSVLPACLKGRRTKL